ncbi:hypothetical protein CYMTET_23623 [Cymbomonas tetramitiformis]|uniref:EGF-like domain-containing protein n=1 Tax=Cymbomonas tetramitiformis TaxID=36881 RepID=A0AAE0FYX5_9CHLO|nr:hypothetical protein CYMTET_23623 [Cymbomonas tetramitiformis]
MLRLLRVSAHAPASVDKSHVTVASVYSGSVHVSTSLAWTEAHIAAGASPEDFVATATSAPSQIFAASSLLSSQTISSHTIRTSFAVSAPMPESPASWVGVSPCVSSQPCFPGGAGEAAGRWGDNGAPGRLQGAGELLCACLWRGTPGSRIKGFEGDGVNCTDVDECETGVHHTETGNLTACESPLECTNLLGGFECSGCPAGYLAARPAGGRMTCVDVDECQVANGGCDFLTECGNVPGGSSCGPCPAGYTGTGVAGCVDVDECAQGDRGGCAPQARCKNLLGSSTCGPCEPVPPLGCARGGVQCGDCPEGMSGSGQTKCFDYDGCEAAPCFEGVACTDVRAPGVGAVCGDCPEGHVGDGRTCELEACLRQPFPCSLDPPVACSTIPGGGFSCGECPEGYMGDGVMCADVDECATNNGGCHSLSTCQNGVGGRACGDCPLGYNGNGYTQCLKQTLCQDDNGGCDPRTTCTDTASGAPLCGDCPAGYAGDGAAGCVDIDGCQESTCYPGVHCEDIPAPGEDEVHAGGHICGACPVGMVGDGVTCLENPCFWGNGGCDPGVSCAVSADHPAGRVCGACPVGYTDEFTGGDGTRCEPVDGCRNDPCPEHRQCTDLRADAEVALGVAYTCSPCPSGFLTVGSACEDVDECAVGNGGCWMTTTGDVRTECVNTPGGHACGGCPEGLRGSGLTGCAPTTDCADNNGGCWVGTGTATGSSVACTQTELGSVCGECPAGFEGDGAGCADIDGCALHPCFPGVECTDRPAPSLGFTCGACPEGYHGSGERCTLCRMLVGIEYTTAVHGKVVRAGWHRGERELIGGKNNGLDNPECVNAQSDALPHLLVRSGARPLATGTLYLSGASVGEGVHFSWRGASSDGSVLALDASRNKADTYTLNVPKADLVVGRTYTFRLEASLAGNPLVAASASAEFFVDSQPLVVVVQGGDTLTGEGSPVTLNASMSIDPDGKEGEIAFTWRCFVAAATSEECRHVNGTALAPVLRGPVVALLLEGTVPARSYTFIVAGRKGARLTEVSTRVSIITGMPPVAEIEPLTTKVAGISGQAVGVLCR